MDKEGVVSEKDQKKLLSEKSNYEYVKKDELLYPQKDVFQLFKSIQRALDSNEWEYIAHHLLGFTYESIEGFEFDLNKKHKGKIIYEIEEILKNKDQVVLTKEENGFYRFSYKDVADGRFLLKVGEWRIIVGMIKR